MIVWDKNCIGEIFFMGCVVSK